MAQSRIKHRDEHAAVDRMVQSVADQIHDIHQMVDALHGKTAGFNRDNHFVASTDRIDGQKSQLLRADYALRAVPVPKGDHKVAFKYQPKSFYWGASVTVLSILSLAVVSLHFVKKKKF